MSRRTSTTQRDFEQSLRSYSSNSRRSASLNQKQDLEFNQIHNILKQNTNIIEKGDYNSFRKSISLLMADKQFALKKHVTIDVFVPHHESSIGLKLLKQKEFWIILLIYFELFAKKGEVSEKQYGQMIQTMKENVDSKLCIEIQNQAYNFCLKGEQVINFVRGPSNYLNSDDNSNLAQCSNRGQSLQDESIQPICPNNSGNQSQLNFQVTNNQYTQTEQIYKVFDEISEIQPEYSIQPFFQEGQVYQIDPKKQKELDELVDFDQEQHQKERHQISNEQEYSEQDDQSMSQFYSQQCSMNKQRKRKSRSLVGIKLDEGENFNLGSGYVIQERKSKSKVKQRMYQYVRGSRRISQSQKPLSLQQDSIVVNEEIRHQYQPLDQQTQEEENSIDKRQIQRMQSIPSKKGKSKSKQVKEDPSNIIPENEKE